MIECDSANIIIQVGQRSSTIELVINKIKTSMLPQSQADLVLILWSFIGIKMTSLRKLIQFSGIKRDVIIKMND